MGLRRTLSMFVALLLAACGSQPTYQPRVDTPTEPVGSAPVKPPKKASPILKRGGGFYKDDGPADEIPENLDAIPDAEPRSEPLHRFANKPYVALGKAYWPNTTVKPYKARGIASWYGKRFHGQRTSIGEPYDMFSMTAAHPTLAIPSYVRVRNVGNGKTVIVRVIDRGPFHADRLIDLSYAAAYKLDLIGNGSGLVEVEAIMPEAYAAGPSHREESKTPTVVADESTDEIATLIQQREPARQGVFIQLGAFANADNAESLRAHLVRELDWLNETIQVNVDGSMHRVHLGPYATRSEAERIAERIRLALGYKPTFVVR